MFRNYLTVAVRSLAKNRLYSAINILGLALGLASCILILLFVRDEVSFDQWIPNSDRIYRVESRFDIPGRSPLIGGSSPGPVLAAMQKDFSEVETGTRMLGVRPVVKRGGDLFREPMMLVDPTFFDVFALPLVEGSSTGALTEPASVVISESMARKYFGNARALGQVLPATFNFGQRDLRVTGVFKDLPGDSHFKFDFIGRITEADFDKEPWQLATWTSINALTYIKLRPGAQIQHIRQEMPAFTNRNAPTISFGGRDVHVSDFLKLSLLNLRDIHLHSRGFGQMRAPGDTKIVATFSAIAVMILLIACINFTNLATARASQRAREVALRKVVGAKRRQLVVQFLSESVLTAVIAFVIAIGIVEAALPAYNSVLDKTLSLTNAGAFGPFAKSFLLIVGVGVIAGIYPALYLSGFLPSRILKANKSAAAEGTGRIRLALVVIQFAISIGLLICTAVVYGQTLYAKTMDLGFDREHLLVVRASNRAQAGETMETLKREVARLPHVNAVTLSDDVPTDRDENNDAIEIPGKPSPTPIVMWKKNVDFDFFSTYRIPLIAGRFFDETHGGDTIPEKVEDQMGNGANIIINEKALGRLGFASAAAAVGQQIRISAQVNEESNPPKMMPVTIIGVVGDITFQSVRDDLAPTMFVRNANALFNLTVRYDGVSGAAMRDTIGKTWRELVPEAPYKAEFMDQMIVAQYAVEDAQFKIFAAFAALAILVACLGLYGLASFSAERRTKEIGIRKVLGARVRDVVRLMVWDFSKPVLIANILAWPVAWFLMRDWLDGFQHRIDLSPLLFAAAGIAALMIAWVTVAGQAARVARSNPIFALRYE